MIALKAYYDGHAFVPLEKRLFKNRQQAVIVIDEEPVPQKKTSCRRIAAQYANPTLIAQEESVIAMAFSGDKE